MKDAEPIRKVVLVLRMSGAAGRDLMTGVFRYAQANRHWNIRLFQTPDSLTSSAVRQIERDRVDGIIASELGASGAPELLACSSIPLVVVGLRMEILQRRARGIAFIRNDDREIGRAAARYFLKLGRFRDFGFVPAYGEFFWSEEREAGYRELLAERGIACKRFEPVAPSGSTRDRRALETWLATLRRPSAVLAAWDYRATQVLEALGNLGIAVPDEMSVLGVDNDELLCDFTNPPLSSILPDHEQTGYRAAEELDRLMSGRADRRRPRTVICHLKGIVERESTKAIAPAALMMDKALTYIDRFATTGIKARDVVAHLGCSRRLADLRFRQYQHKSILELLTERRLQEVRRRLRDTTVPIATVSRQCGFDNPKHLKRLFKAHFGMTMSDYRAQAVTDHPAANHCTLALQPIVR